MPISPEHKRLAESLRKLAAQEEREEVAADLLRRADLIEAGRTFPEPGDGTDRDADS